MITAKKYLPTQRSKLRCLWVFLMVSLIYIFENSSMAKIINPSVFIYAIKPLLWAGAGYTVWLLPSIKAKAPLKHRKLINLWSFNFAVIYIIVCFAIGLFFDGIGKSPYSHTPTGIITNIYFVGTVLIAKELARSCIVNNLTDHENYKVFILVAAVMTVMSLSMNKIGSLYETRDIIQYVAKYVIPGFSENLLATYLVFLGGPFASIIYLGIVEGFDWISPIIPNLRWITEALTGSLLPIFFLMAIQSIYLQATKEVKAREKDKDSLLSWIITCAVSIGIVWFSVGVFPIYPSVVATGSMEPMIKPGDVVLIRRIVDMDGIDKLKVGDVIQFKRDNILISHRIIEISKDDKQLRYRTRGDNNSGSDIELVKPEDIKGTIAFVVPKIGWPTLLMKSDRDIPLDEIVF